MIPAVGCPEGVFTKPLASALDAWAEIVGAENVLTDAATLAAYATATFATTQHVPAVVRPAIRPEVQECLRVANQFKVPVYPISGGKNWGNGSRVPVQDGCVVLDLGRMDRIVDFDEALAYVTVEPGVTFGQLYIFLQEHGPGLMMSVPGTTPEASVVGNTVERGHGGGLQVDRFAHTCAFEIVLPTGECTHTGFDRFNDAKAAPLHRWGVGPSLDGLFTQSSLGIVTKMTLWLVPIPPHVQSCFFRIYDDASLEPLLLRVRALKAAGVFIGFCAIWNRYKGVSMEQQYPWFLAKDQVPLAPGLLQQLPGGDAAWTGLAGLYAQTKRQGKEQRIMVREALKEAADQIVVGDAEKLRVYRGRKGAPLRGSLNLRDPRETLFMGVPNPVSILSTYWRKKAPPPETGADPDRDRCGLIWALPALPFDGREVRAAVGIVEEICLEFGFEPHVALICVSERVIDGTVLLMYDRDVPGEDSRARECHDTLLCRLIRSGYYPYRLGLQSMKALPAPRDDSRQLLDRLKQTCDPNNILSPGRYNI